MNPNENNVPASQPIIPTAVVTPAPIAMTPSPTPTPAPVVPPPVTPPPTFTPPSAGKKSHAKLIIALVIVVLLVGATAVFGKNLGLFSSPEKALKDAFLKTEEVTTTRTKGTIDIEADIPQGKQNIQVTFEGASKKISADVVDVDGSFKFTGMGFSASADLKSVQNTLYFRVNEFPFASLMDGASEYVGKWFSMSENDLKELESKYAQYISTSTLEKIRENRKVMSTEEVFALVEKHGLIASVSSEGISTKDDVSVKSYAITLSKEKVRELWITETEKQFSSMTMGGDFDPAEIRENVEKVIDSYMQAITLEPIVIDVGVADGLVHGMSGGLMFSTEGLAHTLATSKPIVAKVKINLVTTAFNEPVEIIAPSESTSLLQLMEKSLQEAQVKAGDAFIKATLSGLRAAAEIYWDKGSSYAGLCTNDSMVKNAFDDLKKRGGITPTCMATGAAYAMSAQLADQTHFCVDSTGKAAAIPKAPTGTVCK